MRQWVVASVANRDSSLQASQATAQVPWHRLITQKIERWMVGFTLVYVVCCAVLYWRYYPDPSEANLKVVEGIPTIYKSGSGRNSTSTIEIEGIRFSCSVDALGFIGTCPTLFQAGIRVRATYFRAATVQDKRYKIGKQFVPILMRLEQSGYLVWKQNADYLFSSYTISSMLTFGFIYLFLCLFPALYFSSKKK